MTSKFFERRAVRNQLKTYLEARNWTGLIWAEGFSDPSLENIDPPFIAISIDDMGREELQMGNPATSTSEKLLSRRAQVDVYMESEDRLSAITDDISDFLDIEPIIVKDNNSNILGDLISDTESILTDMFPPNLNDPTVMEWHGVASCMYEAHYPDG